MDGTWPAGLGRRAVLAAVAVALPGLLPASAAKKPDLAVTRVRGVPAKALTGARLPLKVTVANKGRARSRPAKVTARLPPALGPRLPEAIGKKKLGPLRPRHSTTVKLKATLPLRAINAWRLVVCVPPGTKRNDCRASSTMRV